jgi:hypothetical protein
MTGYSNDQPNPRDRVDGHQIQLRKPFTTQQLLNAMSAALSITVADFSAT